MSDIIYELKQYAELNPDAVIFVTYEDSPLLLRDFKFFDGNSGFNATVVDVSFDGHEQYEDRARRGFSSDKLTFCAINRDFDIGIIE
jgi:hypothetical protein